MYPPCRAERRSLCAECPDEAGSELIGLDHRRRKIPQRRRLSAIDERVQRVAAGPPELEIGQVAAQLGDERVVRALAKKCHRVVEAETGFQTDRQHVYRVRHQALDGISTPPDEMVEGDGRHEV